MDSETKDVTAVEEVVQLHQRTDGEPHRPEPDPTPKNGGGPDAAALASNRKRRFRVFALILIGAGLAYGAWRIVWARNTETTDDAYVAGDLATITPAISGTVKEVRVSETQAVKKGDILVVLENEDATNLVSQARADEQLAIRKITSLKETDAGLEDQASVKQDDVRSMQAEADEARAVLAKAEGDLARRTAVLQTGAISGEDYAAAKTARDRARAALGRAMAALASATDGAKSAQQSLMASRAMLSDGSVDGHPEVVAARARLGAARLDLSRTVLRAPFDGVIARKQVQIGQRVQAGSALMTVVPLDRLYVMANFKENQIRHMAMGYPVQLTSDRYGGKVEYRGRIAGFAGGTGAAFAAIPAQNATGNWIKVVQRVPVKITLDPAQLRAHPLLVGLSMEATVDLGK
jgi:membrane fusion protein (multidrug efflux system)